MQPDQGAAKRPHLIQQRGIVPFALAGGTVDKSAVGIDDEGGGQALDGVALHDLGVEIHRDREVDVGLVQEPRDGLGVFADVDGDHRDALVRDGLVGTLHRGHLGAAGRAPGRPEVQDNWLAAMIDETLRLPGRTLEVELGCLDILGHWREGLRLAHRNGDGRGQEGQGPDEGAERTHGDCSSMDGLKSLAGVTDQ
jgi:hypothetical protein